MPDSPDKSAAPSLGRWLLRPLHRLVEVPVFYSLNQQLARPTTACFRALLADHLGDLRDHRVLDLGCGVGGYRSFFPEAYTGIDVNPDYMFEAAGRLPGKFLVMSCDALGFADSSFDHVVSIATTHHLDDQQLQATVREARRVTRPGGSVHILDAVLPPPPGSRFKRFWFSLDRGRYPRTRDRLVELVGEVSQEDRRASVLHEVCYLCLPA